MKLSRWTIAIVALAAAALAPTTFGTARAQGNGAATYQTANAVDFGTGVPVGGAATLFRSNNNVRARIATSGLDTNAAYTVWWILWNRPDLCSAPCGANDLGISGSSVFYAAGFVTGGDGTANVTAHLDAGPLPSGIDILIPGGLHSGFGLRAEIHMLLRSHGPISPGSVATQIGSFDPACAICEDQQAVAFPPVF